MCIRDRWNLIGSQRQCRKVAHLQEHTITAKVSNCHPIGGGSIMKHTVLWKWYLDSGKTPIGAAESGYSGKFNQYIQYSPWRKKTRENEKTLKITKLTINTINTKDATNDRKKLRLHCRYHYLNNTGLSFYDCRLPVPDAPSGIMERLCEGGKSLTNQNCCLLYTSRCV